MRVQPHLQSPQSCRFPADQRTISYPRGWGPEGREPSSQGQITLVNCRLQVCRPTGSIGKLLGIGRTCPGATMQSKNGMLVPIRKDSPDIVR
ncbi:hypothetical protein N7516_002119 [Penicillium verrucosum]|uniref:uncharacterized protein n=1 Tax=Penicillium verrucosum TaxID=60171 RepID=UPI0025456BF6|nr:uncharacterized protein N7516_002119 [Penicillium verrucosum]KAJ5941951.1 hypothetical protein N7516_002119 [Penicillium verrucosum]